MITSMIIGFSGFGFKIQNLPSHIDSGYNKKSIKYIADRDEDMEELDEMFKE